MVNVGEDRTQFKQQIAMARANQNKKIYIQTIEFAGMVSKPS